MVQVRGILLAPSVDLEPIGEPILLDQRAARAPTGIPLVPSVVKGLIGAPIRQGQREARARTGIHQDPLVIQEQAILLARWEDKARVGATRQDRKASLGLEILRA